MNNIIGLFLHKRRFKKGEIVRIKDKKKRLNLIGVYSGCNSDGVVTIYMVYHVGETYSFNTRGLTIRYNTVKKIKRSELDEYLKFVEDRFSLVWDPELKQFWMNPDNYQRGEKFFTFTNYGKLIVDYFGNNIGDKYIISTVQQEYLASDCYPYEYNRAVIL